MHLDEIVAAKRSAWSGTRPPAGSRAGGRATPARPGAFAAALGGSEVGIIAEVKPKSPSKGDLLPRTEAVPLARTYAAAGAAAVSVLADTPYFGGSPDLVAEVANDPEVTVPVLFKDFLVDVRQVQLAYDCGADAVLVIVRAVDDARLADLLAAAGDLGLDALVETFTEEEVERAVRAGAQIIGVNNRDLRTFEVDLDNSVRLHRLIPPAVLTVSESGLNTAADIARIAAQGFSAALIGESLLTSNDPAEKLRSLRGVPIAQAVR
ncbi:indole-3-glycerol phosphate synthase TrpC [Micromonospora sp. FIMYZ51]|uniref:indole-3-glycerol phosphate synthase TrpC n=1 Tax=Micromonospora sp. FIMYZ51 TaxID=3051832 RepID=UPI003120371C